MTWPKSIRLALFNAAPAGPGNTAASTEQKNGDVDAFAQRKNGDADAFSQQKNGDVNGFAHLRKNMDKEGTLLKQDEILDKRARAKSNRQPQKSIMLSENGESPTLNATNDIPHQYIGDPDCPYDEVGSIASDESNSSFSAQYETDWSAVG